MTVALNSRTVLYFTLYSVVYVLCIYDVLRGWYFRTAFRMTGADVIVIGFFERGVEFTTIFSFMYRKK